MNDANVKMDPDLETFRYAATMATQRMAAQTKCIDLSIQVSLGLAVGFAGSIFALVFKETNGIASASLLKIAPVIVPILFFYLFIQLLLLTTYIYHSVAIMAWDFNYGNMTWASARKQTPPGILQKIREREDFPFKNIACVVNRFQPVVLYASILMGWLLYTAIVCCVLFRVIPHTPTLSLIKVCILWVCLAFSVFYVFVLYVLGRVHREAKHFGEHVAVLNEERWGSVVEK